MGAEERQEAEARDATEATDGRAPRRGPRRAALWFGAVAVLVMGVYAAISRLQSQPLAAGEWVTDRIAARADALFEGADLRFGQVRIGLDLGYNPQVFLEDVTLTRAGAVPLLDLRSVQVDLTLGDLLAGEVALRRVALSGAVMQVRRGADGAFDVDVSGGADGAAAGQPVLRGVADLLAAIDTLLARPELSQLREVTAEGLTLNYSDVISGETWTGDGGLVRLTRDASRMLLTADVALLTGRQDLAALSASVDRNLQTGITSAAVVIEDAAAADIASQAPALAWLSVIDAPVSAALRARVGTEGLRDFKATLELGAGALRPTAQARAVPFTQAFIALDFDPAKERLRFEELLIDTAWGSASAGGTAQLQDFEGLVPREIVGQFQVDNIVGNPGGLYDRDRALDGIDFDFRLRLDPFTLDIGQAVVTDGATTAQAAGTVSAGRNGWTLALDGAVDTLHAARVRELWPTSFRPGMRNWITTNVEEGTLHDARWSLRRVPGEEARIAFTQHFTDARVNILPGFPKVEDGVGSMVAFNHAFAVLIEEGTMAAPGGGLIDAGGSAFEILDMREKPARARVTLATESTITAALAALDQPPFRFLSNAGQPVTLAEGTARVRGTIEFPIKPRIRGREVTVDVAAALGETRSDTLLAGRELALVGGEVRVTNDGIEVAGTGTLDTVPLAARWVQPLGQGSVGSTLSGQVTLAPETLTAFGISLPRGALAGRGQGDLALRFPPGEAPRFALTSDLEGLRVAIPGLGWTKSAATEGAFTIEGRLGAEPGVEAVSLEGPGFRATGALDLTAGGGLGSARFGDVRVGDWFRGAITLRGRGGGVPPAITLSGGRIDLRRAAFAGAETGGGAEGPPLSVALDALVITEGITLTDLVGDFTTTGGLAGAFRARVNGGTPIEGVLSPSAHGPTISLRASDAGGVIRDAGIFRQVRGGGLVMRLVPRAEDGSYDGTARLTDIRVEDAPSMAALLSAVSVVGLLEQLDGGGLAFSEVESSFRIAPGRVIVGESSAVGASLGISLDGVFDTAREEMDFQGVISPFFLVNSIGSFLTRRGEGLIGFNFTLSGTSDAPQVSVNPLSVLTPGMFREIFRRAPPEMDQ